MYIYIQTYTKIQKITYIYGYSYTGTQLSIYMYTWVLTFYLYACMLSCFSHVWLFGILQTVACQNPPSMEFSSKNIRVGFQALLQRIFPNQGSNPSLIQSSALQVCSLPIVQPGNSIWLIEQNENHESIWQINNWINDQQNKWTQENEKLFLTVKCHPVHAE